MWETIKNWSYIKSNWYKLPPQKRELRFGIIMATMDRVQCTTDSNSKSYFFFGIRIQFLLVCPCAWVHKRIKLIGLILDLGSEVISDVSSIVSDFVLDDERNIGGHGQRHLGRERSRLAEEVEVAEGERQTHLERESKSKGVGVKLGGKKWRQTE